MGFVSSVGAGSDVGKAASGAVLDGVGGGIGSVGVASEMVGGDGDSPTASRGVVGGGSDGDVGNGMARML